MATYETILEATVKAGVEHFGGFPPGSMIAFAGKAIPEGWLLCNGALVSRTTYAKLFAAIGTAWGAGDGSTTFKLPDADGRVMQGVTDVGRIGKYLESSLPNITGTLSTNMVTKNMTATGAINQVISDVPYPSSAEQNGRIGLLSLDAKRVSTVYGKSATVQPAALQTLIIIKV